jgi:micrococcal nuclease
VVILRLRYLTFEKLSHCSFLLRKTRSGILLALLCVILSFSAAWPGKLCAGERGKNADTVAVRRVDDGDTISAVVSGHFEKIRLIGIDAPEIGQKPWGEIAKRHLTEMIVLSSWEVTIEYDIEKRDKYGRLLAYLRTKKGRMVNRAMLREGYAVIFTLPPNMKYAAQFTAAERYARKRKSGIWSCNGIKEQPVVYRREHPRFR